MTLTDRELLGQVQHSFIAEQEIKLPRLRVSTNTDKYILKNIDVEMEKEINKRTKEQPLKNNINIWKEVCENYERNSLQCWDKSNSLSKDINEILKTEFFTHNPF